MCTSLNLGGKGGGGAHTFPPGFMPVAGSHRIRVKAVEPASLWLMASGPPAGDCHIGARAATENSPAFGRGLQNKVRRAGGRGSDLSGLDRATDDVIPSEAWRRAFFVSLV